MVSFYYMMTTSGHFLLAHLSYHYSKLRLLPTCGRGASGTDKW